MGMKLLYGLAAFLETGIGIWIFGQMFPKRERMEKRHRFSEWVVFLGITSCAYSFPNTFGMIANKRVYICSLVGIHVLILCIYTICKKYRKQSKDTENRIVIGLLFLGIVACIVGLFWTSYQSFAAAILGNIWPVFFLWAFYQCSFTQAYLWQFFYETNLGMLKNVYITYAGIFTNRSFDDFFYWPRNHVQGEILYIFVICGIFILINKYTPLKSIVVRVLKEYKAISFLCILVEWSILLKTIEYGSGTIEQSNLTVSLISAGVLIFCMMVLYIRAISRTADAEKKLLNVRNEVVERQYEEIKDAYERYRCVVHDEKHMLLYLKECLENQDMEHAKQVVDRYQTSLNDMGRCRWTGIQTVDFILSIKKRRMEEQAVKLELDCQLDSIPIEETDFIVLFSNLLDNAIEAAEQCPADRRKISIVVKNVNSMFYLKMTNSCQKQPQIRHQRFLTSKADQSAHGWGIESVKHIVEKYDGEIQFHDSRESFEVILTISH